MCVCTMMISPGLPKRKWSIRPILLLFFLSLSLSILFSCYFVLPSSRLLKKNPEGEKILLLPAAVACLPSFFVQTSRWSPDVCYFPRATNRVEERERENLLKTPAKRKKKKVSERKHCVSPGSILIRVQLSSSSPLVPIEIAPINSRPNEKGCWHLLCVREEKKISFFLFTSGTMERINDAQVETIFFHLSLYMYRPMCIYLFIVRVFGCGQPLP